MQLHTSQPQARRLLRHTATSNIALSSAADLFLHLGHLPHHLLLVLGCCQHLLCGVRGLWLGGRLLGSGEGRLPSLTSCRLSLRLLSHCSQQPCTLRGSHAAASAEDSQLPEVTNEHLHLSQQHSLLSGVMGSCSNLKCNICFSVQSGISSIVSATVLLCSCPSGAAEQWAPA